MNRSLLWNLETGIVDRNVRNFILLYEVDLSDIRKRVLRFPSEMIRHKIYDKLTQNQLANIDATLPVSFTYIVNDVVAVKSVAKQFKDCAPRSEKNEKFLLSAN